MKKFLILIACSILGVNLASGQSNSTSWTFGLGFNAVDYRTHVPSSINLHYSALRFSLSRRLVGEFSGEISGSLNIIDNFSDGTSMGLDHAAVDLSVLYNFAKSIYGRYRPGNFNPYLGAGVGYTTLKNIRDSTSSSITSNFLAGTNYRVSENFSVFSQGAYKIADDDWIDSYFEYVLGIKYDFNI